MLFYEPLKFDHLSCLSEVSRDACMFLLTATSTLGLGRRHFPQW